MRLFHRTRVRTTDAEWKVEDTAGRLGRVLAQEGPHDERIGHHRVQEGNSDPTRKGVALVRSPEALARPVAKVLRLPKGKPTHEAVAVPTASRRVARG